MRENPIGKIAILLFSLLFLSACKAEVLAPTGDVAAQQRDLLVLSTLLMLIIIVPVMLLVVWFSWHYRASNTKASYKPNWDHSTKLELIIWAVPLMIVIALGALTWVGTHLLDPYRPLGRISAEKPLTTEEPLKVEVVALDWKWLFIYPQYGVAAVNELAVPVDRPVQFTLTSSSVMNAFYIPAMAGMIYAMPGMQTTLHGVFNAEGTYQGLASHYSGWGFSGMRFKAKASDAAGFDAWVAAARAGGRTLDRPAYLDLERPSENVKPETFAAVEPHLFSRVVNMCVEEGKICMAEMMALDREGGTGLAGTMNVSALTYDKDARRGTRAPVLGWEPFQVTGFCSIEEEERMFGVKPAWSEAVPRDPAHLRGHGLVRTGGLMDGLFDRRRPEAISLAEPADAGASNL
ncbi:ubiquinol oxidase subunit II [Ensifer soli]|uniref:ubiquinol oxidase subunit II n=1 Tax=Ciceribacter sp. sgz301302 TaxID=3342379 RepID=UPI0035BA5B3E